MPGARLPGMLAAETAIRSHAPIEAVFCGRGILLTIQPK
jgi:hypothetical protein